MILPRLRDLARLRQRTVGWRSLLPCVAEPSARLISTPMGPEWQVYSGVRTSIFLSATSSDLRECRRRASEILLEAGIFPVVQDHFAPDSRHIEELLADKILASDAVVCLIGHAFGAAPSRDGQPGNRSYTQIEYDLAQRFQKKVYRLVATDAYCQAHPVDEPQALRSNQQAYRQSILAGPALYQWFSSVSELESLVHSHIRPLLAHAGRRSIKYVHLPPTPTCFVGRSEEIQQIHDALSRPTPAVAVILGMGGQGKTTLLAQALRQTDTLPFAAGLWVSAERSNFTFSELLDSALSAFLEGHYQKADMPRVDARARALLNLLQQRPLLLVIDAVERWLSGWGENREIRELSDLSLRQGAFEGLDEFLLEASALENGSHVVLTSRALPAALDSLSCTIVPVLPRDEPNIGLRGLPKDAAVELLERLGINAPEERLREVADALVCHPLALTGFARVGKRLGAKWESLLATRGADPSNVFESLVDEIREHLPNRRLSERVLAYAALTPEGLSLVLLDWLLRSEADCILQPSAQPPDALPVVLGLADWSLLIWEPATETIRVHALIAAYFGRRTTQPQAEAVEGRAAAWYEAQYLANADPRRGILAIRHAVRARRADVAYRVLFRRSASQPSLYARMMYNGDLWDCAELLESLERVATDEQRTDCFLARADILHQLELSARVLADVQATRQRLTASYDAGEPSSRGPLGRCYGLEAAIHLATGRASDALPLLDRAVQVFDTIGDESDEARLDVVKTVANRGLARWSCGDWDGAEEDYRQGLERLTAVGTEARMNQTEMSCELRARIATLSIDRGYPAASLECLESVISTLQENAAECSARPNKNTLMTQVALAEAYSRTGAPARALGILRDLLMPLEELARQGRIEWDGVRALVRVDEADALLLLKQPTESLRAADIAVALYEELLARSAMQFQGQLATALFRRAEARFYLQDDGAATQDLRRALHISEKWLREWYGECDIQKVFLENAMRTLSFLPGTLSSEKATVMRLLTECGQRIHTSGEARAATAREAQILAENAQLLRAAGDEVGVPWHFESTQTTSRPDRQG
jgi:tetratricopeptide (TPR) repeat protein